MSFLERNYPGKKNLNVKNSSITSVISVRSDSCEIWSAPEMNFYKNDAGKPI